MDTEQNRMKAFREATKFCLEKTIACLEKIKIYLETTAVCLVKMKIDTSQLKNKRGETSLGKRDRLRASINPC
jgi:hypothetical protein